MMDFDSAKYESLLEYIFKRFPSVQNVSFAKAYKPGLEGIKGFCDFLGNPQDSYPIIHVAGTNGKGSVSSMLASVLAATGKKVALYTSPHIVDFRERARLITNEGVEMVPKHYVYDFLVRYKAEFEHRNLSFFEITTALAFKYFSDMSVDIAVIETGLGGRLDSTNIVNPILSIITSIAFDHCALLGDSLDKIAFEKAGIVKDSIAVVLGKMPEIALRVIRQQAMLKSSLCVESENAFNDTDLYVSCLENMDLRGSYQRENLNTVLSAISLLSSTYHELKDESLVYNALVKTSVRTEFIARWQLLDTKPDIIADIGHNPQAWQYNLSQLQQSEYSHIYIVMAVMRDKDIEEVLSLLSSCDGQRFSFVLSQAHNARSFTHLELVDMFKSHNIMPLASFEDVKEAVEYCKKEAIKYDKALIYLGGSTFLISEYL